VNFDLGPSVATRKSVTLGGNTADGPPVAVKGAGKLPTPLFSFLGYGCFCRPRLMPFLKCSL